MKAKLVALSLMAFFVFSAPALAAPADQALNHVPVCFPSGPDSVFCHARVVVNREGRPQASASPTGYGSLQFRTAYGLTGTAPSGTILAIVDAFDDPTVEQDLAVYSHQFGLPDCTKAAGCLTVVNQDGNTSPLPSVNSGWALEISLDVQVAHAVCPDCKILLVEANDNSYTNLMAAVDRAVTMGATVVSNSYGSREFSGETSYDTHFNVPGKAFTFSSGDSGYGTSYPAASRFVTAVGGTTLYVDSNDNYLSEKAWSGAGSGCSTYESKPFWQTDSGCSKRTIADVSADADPSTGAAVYDSTPYSGQTGWWQVGGTSLSSPIIAGVYALKGVSVDQANSLPYANLGSLHDITSGNNGHCKKNSYLCTAKVGYDGPTGLGSPFGIDAF